MATAEKTGIKKVIGETLEQPRAQPGARPRRRDPHVGDREVDELEARVSHPRRQRAGGQGDDPYDALFTNELEISLEVVEQARPRRASE